MYPEQLESLIKSILADGKITEKERAVLHKKAEAYGVDVDEIDVYVDGLADQMKSKTPKSAVVDFKFVTKCVGDISVCYLGKKWYCVNVSNKHLTSVYLNFYKKIEDNKISWGVVIVGLLPKCYEHSCWGDDLLLKTETNNLQLPRDLYGLFGIHLPQDLCQNDMSTRRDCYRFDEEMLKLLCDAKHVTMSTKHYANMYDEKNYNDISVSLDDFVTYAQVFYRSMVDNTAYKDVAEKQKEKEAKEKKQIEKQEKKDKWFQIIMFIIISLFLIISTILGLCGVFDQ